MDIRVLEVTAPLDPKEGFKIVAKRLATVAAFYGVSALIGGTAVVVVALLAVTRTYLSRTLGGMNTELQWLLLSWLILTASLVALLIYRSTLIGEGPPFDDENDAKVEPGRVHFKMIDPFVRILGAASGVITIVMAALIYLQHLD